MPAGERSSFMSMEEQARQFDYEEKELRPASGLAALAAVIGGFLVAAAGYIYGGMLVNEKSYGIGVLLIVVASVLLVMACIMVGGFHLLNPREALVMTLFGKYIGTIKKEGFYWLNPFCVAINPAAKSNFSVTSSGNGIMASGTGAGTGKKVSMKTMTLNNERQKVNDVLGNPIMIGAVVIWQVANPTKAVLNVNNYKTYLSIQCDTTIRNIARLYPYDTMEGDEDEATLRGSSIEIAEHMKKELQERVEIAGLSILEVRITHLAYAEEIAAAMLQKQQAVAIIAARQKIVEGAVSMVEMAINQLGENEVVNLDEERKAAMVSNLLVVLCGNKDAQPVVNSGSIY